MKLNSFTSNDITSLKAMHRANWTASMIAAQMNRHVYEIETIAAQLGLGELSHVRPSGTRCHKCNREPSEDCPYHHQNCGRDDTAVKGPMPEVPGDVLPGQS